MSAYLKRLGLLRQGMNKWFLVCMYFFLLISCSREEQKTRIKIACSPVPHGEILEIVKKELNKTGVDLEILCVEDYNIPNKLLDSRQVDANFFQHIAYLEDEMKRYGYDFSVLLPVHIEPLGIYSKKIKDPEEIKKTPVLVIAVPNDKSNQDRALKLLVKHGILCVKKSYADNAYLSAIDVEGCFAKVKIIETDAAVLPRCLSDVDLVVSPTNVVLLAGLDPKEALSLEGGEDPTYFNVVVVRTEDLDTAQFVKLKEVMSSPQVKQKFKDLYKNKCLTFF